MLTHASPDFLRRFVPLVLAGDALVCQFFSEPSSGSDLAGIRTRATKDGERWILNGQKVWSTLAHLADYGLCLARTDWEAPKHKGLTWYVVPCTSTGLTIRPLKQIGGTSEFCEEFFDNVVVPEADVIGVVNEGWTVTQTMLVYERGAGRPSDGISAVGSRPAGARHGAARPDNRPHPGPRGETEARPSPHDRLRRQGAGIPHRGNGPS